MTVEWGTLPAGSERCVVDNRDTIPQASGEGPLLFRPLTIRGVTIPNRIMVSPMCQYSAVDGYANDWHLVHLGGRAVGGAGLVMLETTSVVPEGRISGWDLGLWRDDQAAMLARIAEFMATQGTVPAIQIGHAGRKASQRRPWEGGGPLSAEEGGWQTYAPSAVPFDERWPAPREMTPADIQGVIDAFAATTRRARDAGFQIIEIHGAHGYLVNQFLGEGSNRRTDRYGGSFENRMRFPLEVVESVRAEWPEHLPLFIRISAVDWTADGWGLDDSLRFCRALKERGVDLIDVSAGGNASNVSPPLGPGYQVPFSEAIRREVGIPTAAVGLITEPVQAEAILEKGQADLVALGRELLRSPYWPFEAAAALGFDTPWRWQYARAKP